MTSGDGDCGRALRGVLRGVDSLDGRRPLDVLGDGPRRIKSAAVRISAAPEREKEGAQDGLGLRTARCLLTPARMPHISEQPVSA